MTTTTRLQQFPQLATALAQLGINASQAQSLIESTQLISFEFGSQIEIPKTNFLPYLVAQGQLKIQDTSLCFETGDLLTPLIQEHNIETLTVSSNKAILLAFSATNHPINQSARTKNISGTIRLS